MPSQIPISATFLKDPFCYTEGAAVWVGDAEVVSLPPTADAKAEVLAAFAEQLRFPKTFRPSWDDLELCLRDLSWLDTPTVVILHTEVPRLPYYALAVYLDVLHNASLLRSPGAPRLVCVFPSWARAEVSSLVGAG